MFVSKILWMKLKKDINPSAVCGLLHTSCLMVSCVCFPLLIILQRPLTMATGIGPDDQMALEAVHVVWRITVTTLDEIYLLFKNNKIKETTSNFT